MSKLPGKIRKKLKDEARRWDISIAAEKPEKVARFLDQAELLAAYRPARKPVSVRIDPLDLSMLKRIARRKGIPFSQLMAMWVHERVTREQDRSG